MRESRHHHPGGEPCLSPIKADSDKAQKSLLTDARDGNLPAMKKRMRNSIFKKAEDINQRDERNCTPLHYAAKNSHVDMVKFILAKGGDLKAQDKHGWSVLQYAVRYATCAMVEHLINAGADLLHKEKKGWTCLHLAARNGQPDKARLLLERGARVNETQDQGWNALHLAVRYGQPDTISTLLEHGIDINAANRGWTALHLAALNGHTDIASILLNKNAETERLNQEQHTPLDIARTEGHATIVAIILEREFQGGQGSNGTSEVVLPTPPPTPPTAPPADHIYEEVDGAAVGGEGAQGDSDESLEAWRVRLRKQLTRIQNEELLSSLSDDEDDSPQDGRGEKPKDGTMEIRITWKTLEEETSELMAQLERLRLREVNKIKTSIVKAKKEHSRKILSLEKQRHLLESQTASVQQSVPRFEEALTKAKENAKNSREEINSHLERSREQILIAQNLLDKQVTNPYGQQDERKKILLDDLIGTLRQEIEETQAARETSIDVVRNAEVQLDTQIRISGEKVRLLQEDIANSETQKHELKRDHEARLEELGQQLERAERRNVVPGALGAGPERDEHWFGCPVCLLVLKPPTRIFQCPEGHILCEECKENPALVHCPQCRCPLEGQCSRNRALEEVARSYFPMAPSETL